MTINYTDVINLNISDSTKAKQINVALAQIFSTKEGQVLLARIQNAHGTLEVTSNDAQPVNQGNNIYGFTNNPSEYRVVSGKARININFTELSIREVETPNGYQTQSLNSVMVHELFHAAIRSDQSAKAGVAKFAANDNWSVWQQVEAA